MRALQVNEWAPFDEVPFVEIDKPAPGPGELLIRTQAAGVSFATSLVVQGKYQRRPPLPFTPGTEIAGIVEQVGPGSARFEPGDRICAVLDWGALGEYAIAKEVNSFALPATLSFPRAICFTNSYATSAAALTWPHLLNLQPTQTLLVHGASGGVGIAAVEIAKIVGANVIATAGSSEKLQIAKRHGADHLINYREQDFRQLALELTDGRGVNAVYDPVGGDVFMQSLRCLAPEGRICPIGFAGGEIPQIPANLLLVKNLIVCGFNMGWYFGWSPHDARYECEPIMRELMTQLFDWFGSGGINPRVDKTYQLDAVHQAMTDILARRTVGRVAVVMNEEAGATS
ncbi:MAG: NADPH:quinone oxidoreductase family protein [Pseudomonadota bacterium]